MRFRLRYLAADGLTIQEATIEAPNQQAAIDAAMGASSANAPAASGLPGALDACEVLSAEPLREPVRLGSWLRHPESFDVAAWCRELRTLLAAGMTVVEAIDTLAQQQRQHGRGNPAARLQELLGQGLTLSSAMRATEAFPDILIAGIKGSERSSELLAALDEYGRFDQLMSGLRNKVTSAAIYPLLVSGIGAAITIFLLLVVLPRFSAMYGSTGTSLSAVTTLVLKASQIASQYTHVLAAFVAAALVLGFWSIRAGWVKRALLWLIDTWKPLSNRVQDFRLAKLYQTLALMHRGGYPLDEALDQAAASRLGAGIDSAANEAAHSLRRGQRVSTALGEAGLAEPVALRLLAVGERSGNFDTVLQAIGERHAQRFALFLERSTRIIEPIMLLLVSLVVGSIVLLMYMPIFDMAASIR